ncbi:DNA-binding protein [Candidatus Methylacidiphilum fumarolicum]|uniref:helix-turn-helix domain-containing protein n=1 Tax=Candidatus Methylacidiphilum fumarolicum TaxID=591154 RepID=UPI0005D37DFB|nr:helix-turn-helix domain-containing protein [Candidatus Methylacidiphilum fumarolicum]TFE69989.1 hypothetical protein A7K73_05120 [Candidatus Methylacidiphilum fumarolicum]TFE73793.1 DNA-binding protein [Candidatus Methylacidiphilum fumarolicum]TFE75601.1 DNA-binding protein [Candidatus Methylacidiphilum fumarolicum]TFE76765.1 hypothetical protein A7D33_08225 [Candidatus Methylacidiphilum fumarolicum]
MAAYFGVAKNSDYRWIDERRLPAYCVGWLFRFKLSEIEEWVRQNNEREMTPNFVQNQPSSKTLTNRSTPMACSRKRDGNEEIARFFNTTRSFIQGNPDLRDPQVEGWFPTRQNFRIAMPFRRTDKALEALPLVTAPIRHQDSVVDELKNIMHTLLDRAYQENL